jgi:hypothetical protein
MLAKEAEKIGWDVAYVLPPAPAKQEKADEPKPEPKKLVDHQVELAKKLEDDAERRDYLASLASANSDHLPTLVAHLEALKPKDRTKEPEQEAITAAAEAILKRVDEQELARFYGFKRPAETTEAKRAQKVRDGERDALVAALTAKAELLLPRPSVAEPTTLPAAKRASTSSDSSGFERVSATTVGSTRSSPVSLGSRDDFDAVYDRLARWTEAPPHKNIALVHARREQLHERCVSRRPPPS